MSSRSTAPSASLRRPAQPLRPLPARNLRSDHLALKIRRKRFQHAVPRKAGELGW